MSDAAGKASRLENAPYGVVSEIVIAPVLSSVLIPLMVVALPLS